jgi:ribonuclease D
MPSPESINDVLYIDKAEDLAELCAQLAGNEWLCLDTEFIREKTYYPQLCLIQVSSPDIIACIDPLAIKDLSPLSALLADEKITKVFHAASQDMELFYHLEQKIPQPLFDTQIAASLMGLGDQIGYGGLVKEILGINLDKSHSRTDWSQRPLEAEPIRYAADDVRYLRDCYQQQLNWLSEKGRLDWLHDDFEKLTNPARYQPVPENTWMRVKGIQKLRPQHLVVLKELAAWRENRAIASDRPRRWILKDEVLFEMARRSPKRIEELSRVRGLEERQISKHGQEWIRLIEQACQKPKSEWPELAPRNRLGPDQETIADLLMAGLRLGAQEASISPQAIATRKDVERLVSGERELDLLQGWRLELVGKELLALLEGRSGLTIENGKVTRLSVI